MRLKSFGANEKELKKVDSSEIERRYRVFSDQFKNGFTDTGVSEKDLKQ